MVMDYMEHDIKQLTEAMKLPFRASEVHSCPFCLELVVFLHVSEQVKCLMQQLLSAMAYMHRRWYIHRDLKTSNLLYNNRVRMFGIRVGTLCLLVPSLQGLLSVCDFGLARK
jgi:cell division cycle 2-like protein